MKKTLLTLCAVATAATCVVMPKTAEAHHHGCCHGGDWVGFGIGAAIGGLFGLSARPAVAYPTYTYGYTVVPATTTVVPATTVVQQPVVQPTKTTVVQQKFPDLKPGQTLTVKQDGTYVISYQQPVSTNALQNAAVNVR